MTRPVPDIDALFARPVARADDAALVARVLERSVRRDRRRFAVLGTAAAVGALASVVGLAVGAASGAVPEALAMARDSLATASDRLPTGGWRHWATLALTGAAGIGALVAAGSRAWRTD